MNDCFTALGWTPEGRRVRGRPRTVEKELKKGGGGWKGWEVAKAVVPGQKVLITRRDGLMRLMARRDFTMIHACMHACMHTYIHT